MIDKILSEISRLKNELDGYSAREALDYIESYINTFSKSKLKNPHNSEKPNNHLEGLDEAAEKAYPIDISGYSVECRVGATPEPLDYHEKERNAFKSGAQWAMGQGMIREGKIASESGEVGWIEYDTPAQVELMEHFKNGDEIVLQIRKKN